MAMALVESLERNGGRALVYADVKEILIDPTTGAALGVEMANGDRIAAKQGVVSSAGYAPTYKKLLPEGVAKKHGIPLPLSVPPSHGFVMVNCGFKGSGTFVLLFFGTLLLSGKELCRCLFVLERVVFDRPPQLLLSWCKKPRYVQSNST